LDDLLVNVLTERVSLLMFFEGVEGLGQLPQYRPCKGGFYREILVLPGKAIGNYISLPRNVAHLKLEGGKTLHPTSNVAQLFRVAQKPGKGLVIRQ
jgi:hypothetical protein